VSSQAASDTDTVRFRNTLAAYIADEFLYERYLNHILFPSSPSTAALGCPILPKKPPHCQMDLTVK